MAEKPKRPLSLVKKSDNGLSPREPETVLIVEDNEVLRKLFQTQLKHLKLSGDEAMNGQEAVDKVSQNEYGMILMDVSMPVMDGLEATKLIRQFEQSNKRKRVPIIAVTGISDRESCLAAGMDDFMTKPFLLEHLRASTAKWMRLPVS
jgi:two-component system sensor histidine kinase/response regulator